MSKHLTLKHRPQRFDEVAGQETVRAILSRAAATGTVAPAYMFSGTRGVGKTTLARIFAKAINCAQGPAAEPCNQCEHCRQITAGSAVDVAEFDAATHTGVEDIRSLKQDVGFAPISARYKVFIIDEAHMLSNSAFNALLKTLEEPPGRVTFILATTEPHKFPATIVSRCQHYVFQRLPQRDIEAHLARIMDKEGIAAEQAALSLLARRGAGSVRDAMSLLGQCLALGGEGLTAADVRTVLGLAGQEVFFGLMESIAGRDPVAVSAALRSILDRGLDLGFFMREFTECWRNLFLLAQAGDKAFDILDMPEDEARQWLDWAGRFSLSHIHACWQLTLEGQARVKASLEPAMALELLLLNLTYLPRLLALEDAPEPAPSGSGGGFGPTGGASGGSGGASRPDPEPENLGGPGAGAAPEPEPEPASEPEPGYAPEPEPGYAPEPGSITEPDDLRPMPPPVSGPPAEACTDATPRTWQGFLAHCEALPEVSINGIGHAEAELEGETLVIQCRNEAHCEMLRQGAARHNLVALARDYFGPGVDLDFRFPENQRKNLRQYRQEAEDHPTVAAVMQAFDARILHAGPVDHSSD